VVVSDVAMAPIVDSLECSVSSGRDRELTVRVDRKSLSAGSPHAHPVVVTGRILPLIAGTFRNNGCVSRPAFLASQWLADNFSG
jgi:hypothetical protein